MAKMLIIYITFQNIYYLTCTSVKELNQYFLKESVLLLKY